MPRHGGEVSGSNPLARSKRTEVTINRHKVTRKLHKMTRIFGFEIQNAVEAHIPNGVNKVFDNLQEAAIRTYEKGWQAYGLGFIVVDNKRASAFSIYRGYRGIGNDTDIRALITPNLHLALANSLRALFGVLQNNPDNGEEAFNLEDEGRTFPLQSDNWMVITMGSWWNDSFSDEKLPWYNSTRPSLSVIQYLETKPESINFDWIDAGRTPYIIAVKKDGSEVHVIDKYSRSNDKGFSYLKNQAEGLIYYQGVRNKEGAQV